MLNQGLQTATGYFHSASLDIIIIVGLVILCTFLAFQFGKRSLLAIVFALYPALVLFGAFPFSWTGNTIKAVPAQYTSLVLFSVLWFGAFFVLRQFIVSSYPTRHFVQFLDALVLGVIAAGAILATGYHVGVFPSVYVFSSQIAALFSTQFTFFLWLLSPFIGTVVLLRP